MATHTFRNPWAKPTEPQDYVRNIEPVEYLGCEIFHVFPNQFDVVKSGVCISQRVGMEGAKQAAEVVSDLLFPNFDDVRKRMLERYGHL